MLEYLTRPQITEQQIDGNIGRFVIEPLERGFGHTLGSSIRRILLSSLPGAAIVSLKIDGVLQEFSTIPGVKEDVVDLILNFKKVVLSYDGKNSARINLKASGPKKVKAKDFELPPEVEVISPDRHIATLNKNGKLNVEMVVESGRGYVAAERNKKPGEAIGVIPIDSIFTPIQRVSYSVENTRVGQRTDYNKLILEIETNGGIAPDKALSQAAKILTEHISIFLNLDGDEEKELEVFGTTARTSQTFENCIIEELDLSVRSYNCLKREGVNFLSDLLEKSENDLLNIRNFGSKSILEIKQKLSERGLSLKEED